MYLSLPSHQDSQSLVLQEPTLVRVFDRKVRNHRLRAASYTNAFPCLSMLDETANGDTNDTLSIIMQDFYSVHGENAVFIAKKFYKTTAVVKTMGSGSNNLQGATLLMRVPHVGVGGASAVDAPAHKCSDDTAMRLAQWS